MATRLLYLEDFDVTTCDAQVVEVKVAEDGRTVVTLDQTCFYPRGGGQDWDMGTIDNFVVEEVRLDSEGIVWHFGSPGVDWAKGKTVHCHIDGQRRTINTRLHSAAHIVDMAMSTLRPDWVPAKGAHYPHMSFVEYAADDVAIDPSLQTELQQRIHDLQESNYQNKILFMPKEDMAAYCRHVPNNIPTNKPARIVLYADDFGIPCGGTHVKQAGDIGDVIVTKIKLKKGVAHVSYTVSGIN